MYFFVFVFCVVFGLGVVFLGDGGGVRYNNVCVFEINIGGVFVC